ncbi:hypothetical protein BESB_078910 [Besnoitia besnoiti]|uniref:Uncharacterized protein n=1 Tax=Besnoitia besnoiti TaxID=94643 RepID=A0A2A9M6Q5_BESBE|nr:hypothetical protein BESB_078910 [Besnoitia besnoiti]PFH33675.1 hypothetical protein BESB_078910 [Besnoitia besnoiti]
MLRRPPPHPGALRPPPCPAPAGPVAGGFAPPGPPPPFPFPRKPPPGPCPPGDPWGPPGPVPQFPPPGRLWRRRRCACRPRGRCRSSPRNLLQEASRRELLSAPLEFRHQTWREPLLYIRARRPLRLRRAPPLHLQRLSPIRSKALRRFLHLPRGGTRGLLERPEVCGRMQRLALPREVARRLRGLHTADRKAPFRRSGHQARRVDRLSPALNHTWIQGDYLRAWKFSARRATQHRALVSPQDLGTVSSRTQGRLGT